MNEETTQNVPDRRSFEERVFARFDALEAHLDSRLDAFEARLDKMETRIDRLDARLTNLEEKVDQRMKETRPIWEQMLVRLDGIETRLDKFDARLSGIEKSLDNLNRKFRVFNVRHPDVAEPAGRPRRARA